MREYKTIRGLLVCTECSSLVMYIETHNEWHDRINRIAESAGKGHSAWSMQQPLGGI